MLGLMSRRGLMNALRCSPHSLPWCHSGGIAHTSTRKITTIKQTARARARTLGRKINAPVSLPVDSSGTHCGRPLLNGGRPNTSDT